MARSFPLHTHVLALALGLVLLVGGLLGFIGQKLAGDTLAAIAEEQSVRINREVRGSLYQLVQPADMALRLLSVGALAQATTLDERLQRLAAMRAALAGSEALSSLYLGYGDGQFFFVRRLGGDAERARLEAPPHTAYMVQSIDLDAGGQRRGRYLYLDAALAVLGERARPDYPDAFDPRQRDWYRDAPQSGDLLVTPPYLFHSDRQVGITLARRAGSGAAVLGADIRLHTLAEVLARQKVTPRTRLVLVDPAGRVLAQDAGGAATSEGQASEGLVGLDDLLHPAFRGQHGLVAEAGAAPDGALARARAVNGEVWLLSASALRMEQGVAGFVVMAVPEQELMAGAQRQRDVAFLITIAVLCVAAPLTWMLARQIAHPLRALASRAEAIRRFNFAEAGAPRSRIREVEVLGEAMDGMRLTIRRFLELNTAVAGKPDFDSLLPRLLGETLSATRAQGGLLYLATDGHLAPVATRDGDGHALPGADPRTMADPEAGQWMHARVPAHLAHAARALDTLGPLLGEAMAGRSVRAGALTEADLSALGLRAQAGALGVSHAIAVPLINRQGEVVGALLLLLDAAADEDRLAFISALSGLAAVTLEARALIAAQKALFEALIRMIAGAIDARSQHTGGHCARVPELARLLARAACEADSGPYADFRLDENGWELLHIAAWMHDCGKITTPDHVLDKATKLQAPYDRIHEVRMRFEVLKREAELRCLQDILGGADAHARSCLRDEELAALDDDFAFVARCNQGSESMPAADLERLQRIAGRTWMRTLDDRLGLSHEEVARKAGGPVPPLPHPEPLLADRPEHLVPRPATERFGADNPWGFRMEAPEWRENMGELHNLGVRSGTLTEEERYLINAHIIHTEIMLRALPFPRHLEAVPEVAASHHEKMDGTGYPKGLRAGQMSPLARMMAIADIFEALTARDRPYKRGNTLSEAASIMARMARDGHIDPDLFALFLRSGAYLAYARRFLEPEQIDAVNVDRLLAGLACAPDA